jgi:HSP20 family protein
MASSSQPMEKKNAAQAQPERVHAGLTFLPAVDIIETRDELLLVADVPGAIAQNVDLSYENGTLTINAQVGPRPCSGVCLLHEYDVGDFMRTFQIGENIDADRIAAEVANGVLTLHLPKAAQAKTRRIQVRGAEQSRPMRRIGAPQADAPEQPHERPSSFAKEGDGRQRQPGGARC